MLLLLIVYALYDEMWWFVCDCSSGLLNFCAVALSLCELGYRPVGVRLDSGDLCRQSVDVRRVFRLCSEQWVRCHAVCVCVCVCALVCQCNENIPDTSSCLIVCSSLLMFSCVSLPLYSFSISAFDSLIIVGTNNISEQSMVELNKKVTDQWTCGLFMMKFTVSPSPLTFCVWLFQENEIDVVGVGTHLVTCTKQPSLGCVYKVTINSLNFLTFS